MQTMSFPEPEADLACPSGSPNHSVHRIVRNSTLNLTAFGLNAAFNLLTLFVLARGLGWSNSASITFFTR